MVDVGEDDNSDEEVATDCAVVSQQQAVALSEGGLPQPTFGNIAVTNSSDVQFGNKTYYNGPVTIKQVVYANGGAEGEEKVGESTTVVSCEGIPIPIPVDLKSEKPATAALLSKWSRLLPKRGVLGASIAIVIVASIISLAVLLIVRVAATSSKSSDELPEVKTRFTTVDNNVTLSGKLRVLDRNAWLAQPFLGTLSKLKTPVEYVIISHSASEPCAKQAQCTFLVRQIQTYHIESFGWQDIAYNFLVGGDGYAYTGRGWDYVGAHTYGWNNRSIGINLLGTFINEIPPKHQILATQQLIELGVELNKIVKDYKLVAHRQLSATESPGSALFQEMKTWPHWTNCVSTIQQGDKKIPVCSR